MADTIIEVENIGKKYLIRHQPKERYLALREVFARKAASIGRRIFSLKSKQMAAPIREEFWALKDVSFEVKRGEVIGIIGRNGAGKSTLLKLLSRITEPTEGRIRIRGRVASLLEVGTGFHPELTGRENIYLNGAILGMSKAEIKGKFDEIVVFSEIEKFLDTPVKRYSSGMYVRLAFAVAAHLQPEILLVDEILAVGDAGFQKKCLGKMDEVSKDGRTVLFISHNMAAVEKLCKISLLIDNGGLVIQGSTEKVINRYLQGLLPNHIQGSVLAARKDRSGNGRIRLTEFHLEDLNGRRIAFGRSGMDIVFVFAYQTRSTECIENVDVGFSIHTADNLSLFVLYTSYLGQNLTVVAPYGEFRCRINRLPLSAGRYRVGARVTVGGEEADWPKDGVGYLDVETGDFFGTGNKGFGEAAPFLIKGQWELSGG
jgi:lipopolysaccharide transport system ATP-binding protein